MAETLRRNGVLTLGNIVGQYIVWITYLYQEVLYEEGHAGNLGRVFCL